MHFSAQVRRRSFSCVDTSLRLEKKKHTKFWALPRQTMDLGAMTGKERLSSFEGGIVDLTSFFLIKSSSRQSDINCDYFMS